jgi:hypothetical protein
MREAQGGREIDGSSICVTMPGIIDIGVPLILGVRFGLFPSAIGYVTCTRCHYRQSINPTQRQRV